MPGAADASAQTSSPGRTFVPARSEPPNYPVPAAPAKATTSQRETRIENSRRNPQRPPITPPLIPAARNSTTQSLSCWYSKGWACELPDGHAGACSGQNSYTTPVQPPKSAPAPTQHPCWCGDSKWGHAGPHLQKGSAAGLGSRKVADTSNNNPQVQNPFQGLYDATDNFLKKSSSYTPTPRPSGAAPGVHWNATPDDDPVPQNRFRPTSQDRDGDGFIDEPGGGLPPQPAPAGYENDPKPEPLGRSAAQSLIGNILASGNKTGNTEGSGSPPTSIKWTFPEYPPGTVRVVNGEFIDADGFVIEALRFSNADQEAAFAAEMQRYNDEENNARKGVLNARNEEARLKDKAIAEWRELYEAGVVTWNDRPDLSTDAVRTWLAKKNQLNEQSARDLLRAGGTGDNFVSNTEEYVKVLANGEAAHSIQVREVSRRKVEQDPFFLQEVERLRRSTEEIRKNRGAPTPEDAEVDRVLEQARTKYWSGQVEKMNFVPDHAKRYLPKAEYADPQPEK